jgi:hypothetical protein
MKRIFSSHNIALVHHSRNLLEAEGVKTEVRNEFLASAMGELPPAECQAELWVLDAADEQRALALLHSAPPGGPDWQCRGCGESSGPQFTHCWNCGALRAG